MFTHMCVKSVCACVTTCVCMCGCTNVCSVLGGVAYFLLLGLPSGSSRLRPLITPLSTLALSELLYSVKSRKLNLWNNDTSHNTHCYTVGQQHTTQYTLFGKLGQHHYTTHTAIQ